MWSDPVAVRTVAAVVEAGTFDGAARALHVTPSAVSQRVKAIEESVGQRLLVRTTPVRPTAAGEVVLRYARRLALLDEDAATELGLAEARLPRLAQLAERAGRTMDQIAYPADIDHRPIGAGFVEQAFQLGYHTISTGKRFLRAWFVLGPQEGIGPARMDTSPQLQARREP